MDEDKALEIFHSDDEGHNFECFSHTNGNTFWYASEIMSLLGYETLAAFRNVVNKAIAACATLGIDIQENFQQENKLEEGKTIHDYRLSRFACYLVAMNGDPKKKEVALAQVYFVAMAETFRHYIEAADNVERVLIRDEISDREQSLSGVAKERGVIQYQLFHNAGYRGMYNMNLSQLKRMKGISEKDFSRSLLDFMGKEELAANLFRVTQTEAKIKNENIKGQRPLETAAEVVGRKVRNTMQEISNTKPEDLPMADDIRNVKKQLKATHKKLKKIDKR